MTLLKSNHKTKIKAIVKYPQATPKTPICIITKLINIRPMMIKSERKILSIIYEFFQPKQHINNLRVPQFLFYKYDRNLIINSCPCINCVISVTSQKKSVSKQVLFSHLAFKIGLDFLIFFLTIACTHCHNPFGLKKIFFC